MIGQHNSYSKKGKNRRNRHKATIVGKDTFLSKKRWQTSNEL
jgi:hypothetical protein